MHDNRLSPCQVEVLQLDTSHAINIHHKKLSYAYIIIDGIMSETRKSAKSAPHIYERLIYTEIYALAVFMVHLRSGHLAIFGSFEQIISRLSDK